MSFAERIDALYAFSFSFCLINIETSTPSMSIPISTNPSWSPGSAPTSSSSLGMGSLLALTIYSRYKINKSLVAAILLPYALEDVAKYKVAQLDKIAHMLRVCGDEITGEDAAKALIEYVRQKIAMANLPTRLKDLKLTIEQLSLAIEDVSQVDLVHNLPRSMTTDDLFDFIKVAF